MFHLYHYVPQCSRCGSWRTGYYFNENIIRKNPIKSALRHGEYAMPSIEPLEIVNCYCGDCGIRWRGNIKIVILNQKQFEEQLKLRGILEAKGNINDFFDEAENDYFALLKERRKKERERRKLKHAKRRFY